MTEKALDLIKKWEGVYRNPYLDVSGIPTIGVGFTTYLDGSKVTLEDPPLDDIQIDRILRRNLQEFEKQVRMLLGERTYAILPNSAIDPLISLIYNIGSGNFSKSSVLKAIKKDKNNLNEIERCWMMWNKATIKGKLQEVKGLTNRRKDEFRIYKEAILNAYTKPECYDLGCKYL